MTLVTVFLDEIENEKVEEYQEQWNLSKNDIIKKMIREYSPKKK